MTASSRPPPPSTKKTAPDPATLAEAMKLFKHGNELRRAGDFAGALMLYNKSRALVPSVPNTLNAALCLSKLGRDAESFELYESLLTKLGAKLSVARADAIRAEVARLLPKLGSIHVNSNVVGARLVIDGRVRGTLPLLTPVRVKPGNHVVKVFKELYEPFETLISGLAAGEMKTVRADLQPLLTHGRLGVDTPALRGAQVYVDGAPVGVVPWEGLLAPGPHRLFVRRGEFGSAPIQVNVVEGQLVSATAQLQPLGPVMRVQIDPVTARLAINSTAVGRGQWSGRLPIGSHQLEAHETGYVSVSRTLQVGPHSASRVRLKLEVDSAHPRWGRTEGTVWFDLFGGFAVSPSLASSAELSCGCEDCGRGQCTDRGVALGGLVGLRGGYEFPFGLSVEFAGGYLSLATELSRDFAASFTPNGHQPVATSYSLTEKLHMHGPLVGGGVGYRYAFSELFEFRSHLLVGAFFPQTGDSVSGTASAGANTVDATVLGSGQYVGSVDLFVMPEAHLGLRFGAFTVSAGLSVGVFFLNGPEFPALEERPDEQRDVVVLGSCPGAADPRHVSCAQGQDFLHGEIAYGLHVVFVPGVSAGYSF